MRALLLLTSVACVAAALLFLSPRLRTIRTAEAANPASGAIAQTGPVLPFTGTWSGTATGTGSGGGEATCVDGVNCDTFRLTVVPGDYTGKIIAVRIQWAVAANDYDLYIHKCPTPASTNAVCNAAPPVGQDGQGAPQTSENAAIDPNSNGAGDYTVHVVYFATAGPADQYQGSATIRAANASRTGTYVTGGITFSPSVTVKAPVASRDGEPSSRTDSFGNFYVGGIRGVPAGNDLWYVDLRPTVGGNPNPAYDPFMRRWAYRGQPDSVTGSPTAAAGAQGGGDIDLAVGFPDPSGSPAPTEPATLAASSLLLTNITVQKSTDRGVTIQRNPLGNVTGGIPTDDRQWQEFLGPNTVYLLYRTVAPTVTQIQRSIDGGLTYTAARTAGAIGQVGYIDVHQKTGTVYVSGSTGQVCHGDPLLPGQEPLTYTCAQAATDPNGVAHIFFPVKVADDGTANGTVYVAYSNDHDVFLVHSTDKGVTWSQPVRVNNQVDAKTNVLPWLETGPTPGSVGIVWYGTTEPSNNNNANWKVYYAQSFNATSDAPTFRQVVVSDHFIHGSNISEGGLDPTGEGQNRNLIDYFQISFDPTGAAVVGYADDHNDFDGHTFVTRQMSGPSIKDNAKTNVPNPGSPPAPEAAPYPVSALSLAGAQVNDFVGDVQTGAVGSITTPDPLDIVSIRYTCETDANGVPVVAATMKVSDLSVVPPNSNWRMNFTSNAPFAGVSPTNDYSFALSDRGDQFYVRATTDAGGAATFTWGTAVRNPDGSITYTQRGTADCGAFNNANGTITVKVATTKLNQFAPKGAIGNGSVLAGLRGQTFTSQASAKDDLTRGGTEFTVGNCTAGPGSGCAAAAPTPTPPPTPTPTPTPTPPTSIFQYELPEYPANEDCTAITVGVVRVGPDAVINTRATVDIASSNGSATQRGDFTFVVGRLVFAPGETRKTFQVLINEDAYTEGPELATLTLQNPQNGSLSPTNSTATLRIADDAPESSGNPIDDSRTFACTHYHDFLYRQSDQSGEDFWTQNIESCGNNAQCRVEHRQDVSTAFFLSIEFQQTGYFVIRAHKAGFGNNKETPRYAVFLRDQRQISNGVIVGQPGFQQQLDANKQAYLEDFVSRPEFVAQFPQGSSTQFYVGKLFGNAGVTPTQAEIQAASVAYGAGDTAGRAAAVKSVADSDSVFAAQYNPSFVLMQYFGYLRRDPDAAPDGNFNGYDFWLTKMNSFSQPGENVRDETVALARVRRAEMVKAFIESLEYRGRFAGSSDQGNQQGPASSSRQTRVGGAWAQELTRAAPTLLDPRLLRFIWPS